MKRILIGLLIGFGFSGCTTIYTKPGASQMDFANDKQFCALYSQKLAGGPGFAANMKMKECMQERGWSTQASN